MKRNVKDTKNMEGIVFIWYLQLTKDYDRGVYLEAISCIKFLNVMYFMFKGRWI